MIKGIEDGLYIKSLVAGRENKIDLKSILRKEGVKLVFYDFDKLPETLYDRFGYKCKVRKDTRVFHFIYEGNKYIAVSNHASPGVKTNMAIARQIGALILDDLEPPNNVMAYEIRLNKFAYDLLMPEDKIIRYIKNNNKVTLKDIALEFQVSIISMKMRLEGLGII